MLSLSAWDGRSKRAEGPDGCAVGGACAADRGVPAAVQDRPSRPASHDRGDHLAARQRREMAPDPGRTGPVVDGGADLQPLVPPGRAWERLLEAAQRRGGIE